MATAVASATLRVIHQVLESVVMLLLLLLLLANLGHHWQVATAAVVLVLRRFRLDCAHFLVIAKFTSLAEANATDGTKERLLSRVGILVLLLVLR